MVTETTSEIDRIEIMNDTLIQVLADLVEFERTNGASGTEPRIELVGDDEARLAQPTDRSASETDVIHAGRLVDDGQLVNGFEMDGDTVYVRVL